MNTINIVDTTTGKTHAVPYDALEGALQAGGHFATQEDKQKAVSLQNTQQQSTQPLSDEPQEPQETHYGARAIAGAERLGHEALSFPYTLGKSIENSAHFIQKHLGDPNAQNFHWAENIPHPKEHDFAQEMGLKDKGSLSERMLEGLVAHSADILGGAQIAKSAIKGGIKLIGKGIERFQAPKLMAQKAQQEANALSDAMAERKSQFRQEENDVNRSLRENHEHLTQAQLENQKNTVNLFPIKSKEATLENLSNESVAARKELEQHFENRYGAFNKDHGGMPVSETLDFNDFLNKTKNLPGLSKTLKIIQENPSKKIIEYNTSGGDVSSISVPGKGATVKEYISFMRELRDAAYDAGKASKNATHGEKMELLNTRNTLNGLKKDVESKIKNSVGNDAFKKFEKIQHDYGNLVGAIKSSRTLSNAAYGNDISESLFKTLLQKKNAFIREHLYQRPDYVTAIREHLLQGEKHPLSTGAITNPAKENLDIGRLLTPEQRAVQEETRNLHHYSEQLQNVSRNIKNPKILTAAEEQQIRNFSPKANRFLDKIAEENHITATMEEEAKRLGISKQELMDQWRARKMYGYITAFGTSAIAGKPVVSSLYHKLMGR